MNICVYGASSNAIDEEYIKVTEQLGQKMASRGHTLVYGAGAGGLMGAAARGAYSRGGRIIGIAPTFFEIDGVLFDKCTEFFPTKTMRERKQLMEDKSEAFIMVPGGIGTFDEFFEILTLKQLGRHTKAIAILDINGYYTELFSFLKKASDEHFMREACHSLYAVFTDSDKMLDYIENYKSETVEVDHMKSILQKVD